MREDRRWLNTLVRATGMVACLAFGAVSAGNVGPSFSKAFSPATIGPGSVSTLEFTIDNNFSGTGATMMAFTDILPAGVFVATPANGVSNCGGTITAPDGTGIIDFANGQIGPGSVCTITVNVTSSTLGTHMNVTGDLTTNFGNSGTASADLDVATDRPGFSKSFAPASVNIGGRSKLTFAIDNSANPSLATGIRFVDQLPSGMIVANPPNLTNTCSLGGTVQAMAGTDLISYSDGAANAGETCLASVDVVATGAGSLANISGELTSTSGFTFASSGKSSAVLLSTADTVYLSKNFLNDPTPAGATVELEFTIGNLDRDFSATGIAFSDNLDATLSGLVATGLPMSACGGTLSGTSSLSFTGGSVAAGTSCSMSVTLAVPPTAAPGQYTNTTSTLTGSLDGSGFTSAVASDDLFVSPVPLLTKAFIGDPVGAGDSVDLQFTVTNTSATSSATDIAFLDELTTFLPFPVSATLPATPCGPGSTLVIAFIDTDREGLQLAGGTLAPAGMAGDSCTFTTTIDIPVDMPGGTFANTTGPISATVDGATRIGLPATDSLDIVQAPRLVKEFTDDPVEPGNTATLQFTLDYPATAVGDATAITFTDDLAAMLAGVTATGLPLTDICGPGNGTLTGSVGDSLLAFSGATMMPGESCAFPVTINIPAGAALDFHTNTTSDVSADVLGVTASASPGQDDLLVTSLNFTKEFVGGPFIAGDVATLRFTLDNISPANDATSLVFFDDLGATLSGLVANAPLPTTPCGAGSSITGAGFLIFSGGDLSAGTSCTFDVSVQVPPATADGIYSNITSSLTATIAGNSITLPAANADIEVDSNLLQLTKSFTDDPAEPGGMVTLEFTLTNLDPANSASAITFTDDLDAALSGLVAVTLPAMGNACNGSGTFSGGSLLTFSGGSLAPGASCVFSAGLQLPASAPLGSTFLNTTSGVTGTINGFDVTGNAASDVLNMNFLTFSKAFDGPSVAGGSPVLTFAITNLSNTDTATDLAFIDDLDAVLPGLVATGTPINSCGGSLNGGATLLFSGGALAPLASCNVAVTLSVPAVAPAGTFPNTTSSLLLAGLTAADPASANLVIEPPPLFSKAFLPTTIFNGNSSTLTFTVDNSVSSITANGLAFSDVLPAGLVVAAAPATSTTCGGTVSAVAGAGTISLTGGTIAGGASCTVMADVSSTAVGMHLNTSGNLTSSSGDSGTASATLNVVATPTFSKSFLPTTVANGQSSTLTLNIDNSGGSIAVSAMDFVDNLPLALTVAPIPGLMNSCAGTVTAAAGSAIISLTGGSLAAGASCSVSVDVVSDSAGSHVNLTGDLTSSAGNSGTATATLTDLGLPEIEVSGNMVPIVDGDTTPDAADNSDFGIVPEGGMLTHTFDVDNLGASDLTISGVSLTGANPGDFLVSNPPAAIVVAGGNTSFDVQFVPTSAGIKQAVINIANDDSDENPFDFAIQGQADDGDGVDAAIEDMVNGPGVLTTGDGNNDGIPDSLQQDVTSLPTVTGRGFMTLVVDPGCGQLQMVTAVASNTLPPLAMTTFDFGLVAFTLPCETAQVDITFHESGGFGGQRYFKYGPVTPGDAATTDWYDFSTYAVASGNRWSLDLADNRLGDDTGDDGIIVDQGGPGSILYIIPTLSPYGLLLLVLAVGIIAARHSRRVAAATESRARPQALAPG